jgi:hypothetical protein
MVMADLLVFIRMLIFLTADVCRENLIGKMLLYTVSRVMSATLLVLF